MDVNSTFLLQVFSGFSLKDDFFDMTFKVLSVKFFKTS